ncbi:MAG: GGDEF domain-containing protein, partial [Selenomonadaceae bacterium]|nr:GGDEF domain-containing protein [Selenomonadaceae bacterium]
RWGGEEFIVLLPGYNAEGAGKVAERLRREVEVFEFDEVGHRTVSVGVAAARPGETEDQVFIRADNALYRAKEGGRNRVVIES